MPEADSLTTRCVMHAFIPQLMSLSGLFAAAGQQCSPRSAEDWLIDRLAHPTIRGSAAYTSHLAEQYGSSDATVQQVCRRVVSLLRRCPHGGAVWDAGVQDAVSYFWMAPLFFS